jgi:hypothetical protein
MNDCHLSKTTKLGEKRKKTKQNFELQMYNTSLERKVNYLN